MSMRTTTLMISVVFAGFTVVPCSGWSDGMNDISYAPAVGTPPYRAFAANSYWNTPLPEDVPIDPRSEEFIEHLKAVSDPDYLMLSGAQEQGEWGMPIYWAKPSDPRRVIEQKKYPLPKEFTTPPGIRIPLGACQDPTSDGELTIYDLEAGWVYGLWIFRGNPDTNKYSAYGGSLYCLDSNGLHGKWGRLPGANTRNTGHRGVPQGAVGVVRYDEIISGQPIEHAFKIALGLNALSASHVWPMLGSDGKPGLIPEGARLRIKPSVDLATKGLSPQALTIATALQKYGAVAGDRGGHTALKLENTVAEGRGWLWKGVLTEDSLSSIPIDDYEFIELGWGENGEWLREQEQ